MPSVEPAAVVDAFTIALYARDWEAVGSFFGDDSVYWDVAVGPSVAAKGAAGIVARVRLAADPLARFDSDRLRTAATGDVVMTEHDEHWEWSSGERMTLPIVSVHRVVDGAIVLWKDYWDYQTLLAAAPQAWHDAVADADMSWVYDATGADRVS